MLQSLVRSQRAQLQRIVHAAPNSITHMQRVAPMPSAVAACSSHSSILSASATSASSSSSFLPRSFATAAAPSKPSKGGKKGAASASAGGVGGESLPELITSGVVYDEFNMIPTQPKPKYEELQQACLTEEQLRFAKRPMPGGAHRVELLPSVYLGAKPIRDHTSDDLGKYFTVSPETLATMPPQIHRAMSQEYMGGGAFHMVRNPGFELVQALKCIESGPEGLKKIDQRVFGVRGESGCGKSAALHYAIQFVREQSRANPRKPWLLVATRAEEFTTETRGFIAPSSVKPGVYDQALYTMDFFANLLKTESEALKMISLKRTRKYEDLVWGPEGTPKGTTLFDLVTLASQDRAQAPRLLYDFTAEIKRATEIPVLVAIDNLNVWDQVCEFIEPMTYAKLDPRKLALVDAFSWFASKPPANGASVWAITTRHATLADAHRHFQFRDVKGLDSWWYSAQELKHCVVHYSVSEFILSEVNQDLLVRINGLTGKVPRDVFKQAFLR